MAKQTNMWLYVIIALIVGGLIGYAAAGGFAGAGQATKLAAKDCECNGEKWICPSNTDCATCCEQGTGAPGASA